MTRLIKAATLAICAAAMLGISGCGNDTPADLALAEARKTASAIGVDNAKFVVKEEKIDGAKAKVILESIIDGKPDGSTMEFKFKKDGDSWKSVE